MNLTFFFCIETGVKMGRGSETERVNQLQSKKKKKKQFRYNHHHHHYKNNNGQI